MILNQAMLEVESGVEAVKSRGLRVIRASIPQKSKLIGTTAAETNFRKKYKAAIVAVQRDGKSVSNKLSQARFQVGDVLVLQVSDDSPLLVRPPDDFYRGGNKKCSKKRSSSLSRLRKRFSGKDNASNNKIVEASDEENQSIHSEDDSSVGDGSYQSGVSSLLHNLFCMLLTVMKIFLLIYSFSCPMPITDKIKSI